MGFGRRHQSNGPDISVVKPTPRPMSADGSNRFGRASCSITNEVDCEMVGKATIMRQVVENFDAVTPRKTCTAPLAREDRSRTKGKWVGTETSTAGRTSRCQR